MEKEKPNYDGRLGPDSAGDKCYEEFLLLYCCAWFGRRGQMNCPIVSAICSSSPFSMARDVETTAAEEDAIETG